MFLQTTVTRFLRRMAQWEEQWERDRTEHLLRSLPVEIQKDIGWPGAARERRRPFRVEDTHHQRS